MLINRLGAQTRANYEAKKIADANAGWLKKKPKKKQSKHHPWKDSLADKNI